MKTLVIAPQPFFTPRGTPFSVYYRTLVMAEQGVPIDLLTYHPGNDVDIPGVRIVRIPRIRWLEPVPIGPSAKKLFLDMFMVLWTIGLLVRHRYPVVHAHEEAVFWSRFLKPVFRFRLIYDMHSSLPQQLENFKFTRSRLLLRIFKWLEDSCLRAADAVITICPDLRDYALASGVPPDRHLLIENSIFDDVRLAGAARRDGPPGAGPSGAGPAKAVEFDPSHPVILYAGTFEAYQGIDILIHAFARVHRRRPDARLVLAGGTDEQVAQMRALAESLGLDDACVFTGRVSKTEALRLTRHAQVLVSPRVHGTNTPLKIYEQLASGRPLVATRIWSHTQVLDDSVCFLAEPEPEAMAAGLLRALEEPEVAAARARRARALYERDYARPIYEEKIGRLLAIVGLGAAGKAPAPRRAHS
jgi:glycosyltransferase involved in cell wall biosynthesis